MVETDFVDVGDVFGVLHGPDVQPRACKAQAPGRMVITTESEGPATAF
jgi:hypothetical protein